ncbi:MAG: hypothetical protein LBT44_00325 [Clostridiales bacterium]|jgi:hypothetical protein|nr:hypothetical protein [Clostridiales bacterium]
MERRVNDDQPGQEKYFMLVSQGEYEDMENKDDTEHPPNPLLTEAEQTLDFNGYKILVYYYNFLKS